MAQIWHNHFAIPTDTIINTVIVNEAKQSQLTMRLKFLLLIEALLKTEGKDLTFVSQADLAKRFNIHEATIHEAFNDLREYTE